MARKSTKIMKAAVVNFEPTLSLPSGEIKGKDVATLQENLTFNGLKCSGKLNFISEYTGFDTNVERQLGYYLPIKFAFPEGTVKATVYFNNEEFDVLNVSDNVFRMGYGNYVSRELKMKLVYIYNNSTYIKYIDTSGLEYKFTSQWNTVELKNKTNGRFMVYLDTGVVIFENNQAKVSDIVKLRLEKMGLINTQPVVTTAKIDEGKVDENTIGE